MPLLRATATRPEEQRRLACLAAGKSQFPDGGTGLPRVVQSFGINSQDRMKEGSLGLSGGMIRRWLRQSQPIPSAETVRCVMLPSECT